MQRINSSQVPQAVGPYSHATIHNHTVYCSGQIGLDVESGELVSGGVETETKQVMNNLQSVLKTSGSGMSQVLRMEIFMTNIDDYKKINEVYGTYFSDGETPARYAIAVADLPKGASVEISCIASL